MSGRCIYCNSYFNNLTDEHVIPYGLSGTFVLKDASCKDCARETSKFELICLRENYGLARIRAGCKSRRKKSKKAEIEILGTKIKVNPDYVPAFLPYFQLPQPKFYESEFEKKHNWIGTELSLKPLAIKERGKVHKATVTQRFEIDAYAKLVAKVAHSAAVAWFGSSAFEPYLPDYILGTNKNLPMFIGGSSTDTAPKAVDHEIAYSVLPIRGCDHLIIKVRFFSFAGGPYSEAVVGKILDIAPIIQFHNVNNQSQ